MPFADAVKSVAVMQNEPYVLLGCSSGNVQVISLLNSSHDLATGAVEAQSMELQPYQGRCCHVNSIPQAASHPLLTTLKHRATML